MFSNALKVIFISVDFLIRSLQDMVGFQRLIGYVMYFEGGVFSSDENL